MNALIKGMLLFCCIGFSLQAQADVIPNAGYSGFVSNSTDGNDIRVVLAPANASGISVNRFSSFVQNNRRISLINTPRLIENLDYSLPDEYQDPAKLIVIIADGIVLDSSIEVIGPNADLIFLNQSQSSISCFNCSFKNANLISLVAGIVSALSSNSNNIGMVSVIGNLTVNSLTAPGSIGLNLVARNIPLLTGRIDSNIKAVKNQDGSYTNSSSGKYKIGAGNVNVVNGAKRWNYDNNNYQRTQLVEAIPKAFFTTDAAFYAPAVEITTSSDLRFNGIIDSRVDLLSSVRYRDETLLNNEGIKLNNLNNQDTIIVKGTLLSNGEIRLAAAGELQIEANAQVDSDSKVTLLSGGEFINLGLVNSRTVMLANGGVYNRGNLTSSNYLESYTSGFFVNDFGGEILAQEILIQSDGLVRNGSRTPYISESQSHPLSIDSNYYRTPDVNKLGLFFAKGNLVTTHSSWPILAPEKRSSKITGDKISIKSQAFENVNPFYNTIDNLSNWSVEVKSTDLFGVSINAETELNVQASTYAINSSALLAAEKDNAVINIEASNLINERYRGQIFLDYDIETEVEDRNGSITALETTTDILSTKVAVHSFPGMIYSLGELNIKSSQSFTNMAGFVETYGDTSIYTNDFRDFGLSLSGISRSVQECQGCEEIYVREDTLYTRMIRHPQAVESSLRLDSQEFDSLFYVGGNFYSTDPDAQGDGTAIFKTLNSFAHFENLAVENFIEINLSGNGGDLISFNYSSSSNNPDAITVQAQYENSTSGTYTVLEETSFTDILIDLYESMVSALNYIISEIDFWSEEGAEG